MGNIYLDVIDTKEKLAELEARHESLVTHIDVYFRDEVSPILIGLIERIEKLEQGAK